MTRSYKNKLHLFKKGNFTNLLLLTLCAVSFSSCLVTKPGSYFKNITRDTTITNTTVLPAELTIKKGDVLTVLISSLSNDEDEIYNLKSAGTANDPAQAGHLVDPEGYIQLHKLGKVQAAGLTRRQLKMSVEKGMEPFLKDPIVSVAFTNHHVTILGEISQQKVLPISEEQISIVDALAQSGSVTALTKLSDVMIVREKENSTEFKHVNLEDNSIFSSPFYYLQPNDVVVLNQDENIVRQQLKKDKYQQYSGIVLQAVSLALIIYQVFFRK